MNAAGTPRTLAEALERLRDDPERVPVAGCTDVMVVPPGKRPWPPRVLDLLRYPELRGVREVDGAVEIGATTTFTDLRRSPLVVRALPALAKAAAVVGSWQIQNRATIGGNVANASPAGDSLPVLLALGASVVVASAEGERTVPYDRFHVGYRQTALRPGEVITRFRIPFPEPGSAQRFRKVGTREAQAISKVVVALHAQVENGHIAWARLGAGSVAPRPVRLEAAEAALQGRPIIPETAEAAGRAAAGMVAPIDDVRSTAEYRSFVLERVVRRMVLSLGGQ